MGLNKADIERLRSAAARFDTSNHMHYLAEAMQCIQGTGDPLGALQLLHAMWSSPYAGRPHQKGALNDIGEWLEQQLGRDPKASAEHITLQLGWLRRLSCYYGKVQRREDERSGNQTRGEPARGRGPALKLECKFGQRIESLRKRRMETAPAVAVIARGPVAPPPPERLPTVFAASFVDFLAARSARQIARERAKRSKPAKETYLAVQPVDPQFRPLAVGLRCSTTATEGFDLLFAAIEKKAGTAVPFYVTDLDAGDGGLLTRRILLELPAAEAPQLLG